jgi:hypothetical protein
MVPAAKGQPSERFAGPIADAHNDLLMLVQHFAADRGYFRRAWLPQLRAGLVGIQVLPVYVDEEWLPELALRQTLRLVETALRTVESCPDELALCLRPGDVARALDGGRIAIVLALEGCPAIGPDPDLLRTFARLGLRMASLTHFGRNSLADGSAEDATGGRLTRAGVRVGALAGLILGIVALTRGRSRGATNTGQAIAGVVCCALALIIAIDLSVSVGTWAARNTNVFTRFDKCIAQAGNRAEVSTCISSFANEVRP